LALIEEHKMPENTESELELLRVECERLRKERDLARKERQDAEVALESESSARLKLLAESLSREIRERFLGSLKNALWTATLLLGIATAGGLWKLSDIVTARVDEKIKEKEQDVAQIRQQIIKSVVDFERQAQKSLEDIEKLRIQVAKESDQATGEIRQAKARILSLEISSQGSRVTVSAAAPEGSGIAAWFGSVSGNVTAVAGSQADKYGYEDPKTSSGAFSLRFQRALQDPSADTNQDGLISVAEAAAFARTTLKRDGFDQSPTVAGNASEVALFSSSKSKPAPERYKTVFAVVVGINKYKQPGANLRGAVNDARGFVNLMERKEARLFGKPSIELLTDEQATTEGIKNAISALRKKATKDDLVVFYFSGHVATVGTGQDVRKVMYPTDGDFEKGGYLTIREVVESIGTVGAKNALLVVDG
jgi:Caspase domain